MSVDSLPEVVNPEVLRRWRARLEQESLPALLSELRAVANRSTTDLFVYALLQADEEHQDAALLEEILTSLRESPRDVCLGGALQIVLESVPVADLGESLKRLYQLVSPRIALEIALPSWCRLIEGVPFDEFRRPFEFCEREWNEDGGLICTQARMELWTRIALKARPEWWFRTFRHWSAESAQLAGASQLWDDLELWGAYVANRTQFVERDPFCRRLDELLEQVVSESPNATEQLIAFSQSIKNDFAALDRAFPLTGVDLDPPVKQAWFTVVRRSFEVTLCRDPSPGNCEAVSLLPPRWQRSKLRIPWEPRRWSMRERITMGVLFLGLPLLGIGFGFWCDALFDVTGSTLWFALGMFPFAFLGWHTQVRSGHPHGSGESIQTYREAIRGELIKFLHEYPLTRPELLKELQSYVADCDPASPYLKEAEQDAALWFYALAARITA